MEMTHEEEIENTEDYVPDYYTFPVTDQGVKAVEEVKEWGDFKEM